MLLGDLGLMSSIYMLVGKWSFAVQQREIRNAYILVGKPKEMTQLWRPGTRWKDNVKMCLKEKGCEGVDWDTVQRRVLLNTVMNIRVS
jgi:hypothetical protein